MVKPVLSGDDLLVYANVLTAVLYGSSAFLSAFAALSILQRRHLRRSTMPQHESSDLNGDTLVFLVRDGALIDANFPGQRFLNQFGADGLDIDALSRGLHSTFKDVAELFKPGGADTHLLSNDSMFQAISERVGDTIRVKVQSRAQANLQAEDIHRLAAIDAELETLRQTVELAPYLVWRETPDGTPIWVNRAYLEAIRETHGDEAASTWPLPRLFPDLLSGKAQRLSLKTTEDEKHNWYDIRSIPIGRDRLYTAYDANSLVHAETQLNELMQTLTKTFSQLTTGLAVFDRSRNLALFNPALTELTRLPVDFLTSRPSLVEVLDKLRENRTIPEPRDYRAWRNSIADLESAALDGTYSETWSLAGNLTYRVTGRPHPDGAIAFLFEDISAEMSLTRQFRHELEISQALLDNMEDATALFSPTGVLLQTNAAYRRLWDGDPETLVAETSIVDECGRWHEKSLPTPVWGDIRDFALDLNDRAEWTAPVVLSDGRVMDCKCMPLTRGGTQVIFQLNRASEPKKTEQLQEAV